MDKDEETDMLVQAAKETLEDVVKGAMMGGTNTETARSARTAQAFGMLLGALVLETRALRTVQERANILADIALEDERDRFNQRHN